MRIRGLRRRRSVDRGFILSDHVDWSQLLSAIEETGAEKILATHGYAETVARTLGEKGIQTEAVRTQFGLETEELEDG
jgi:putative mRNA 3-end processing factor